MKHLVLISFIFLIFSAGCPDTATAQLITDSERKLKTQKQKKDKGGLFDFLQDKNRRSARGPLRQQPKVSGPRYSSGSPFESIRNRQSSPRYSPADRKTMFRSKSTAPRYSPSGSPFKQPGFLGLKKAPASRSAGFPLALKRNRTAPRYSSGSPFSKRQTAVSPRYSPGSPFSRKWLSASPRYSPGSPFSRKQSTASPRYSSGSPFSARQLSANTRYSPGSPFSGKQSTASPRYSPGSPFSARQLSANPRYSPGSPFSRKQSTASPRYSPGSPFSARQLSANPRYSPGSPYSSKYRKTSPRYSPGSPFLAKDFNKNPRYSPGSPFSEKQRSVSPRYSPGSPFDGITWRLAEPRYSTNKHRFDVDRTMQRQSRIYNFASARYRGESRANSQWLSDLRDLGTSRIIANFEGKQVVRSRPGDYASRSGPLASYEGNYKARWIKQRQVHPDFKYAKADQDSEMIRESLRKWNLFMARLDRNKVQPKAVTEKVSRPKFDRKEAEIWND